jgi:REP element-mobilizing transposase RayT
MARRIRLDGPALAHHVMIRGLDGGALFHDADDRQNFVDRMARVLPACRARCFAWALMSNHVHFVLQTEAGALSRVMRRLNTGHAVRLNRRRARRGYVFMDRFRSRIVENDADLIGLIRYVHRNPLDAGIVASLDALAAYPWSGHAALVGARSRHPFEAVADALSLFDPDESRARGALLRWMAESPEDCATPPENRPGPRMARSPAAAAVGRLADLLRKTAIHYNLAPHDLASGARQARIARARAAAAYVAVVEMNLPGSDVAQALGVTRGAVSAALDRGRRVCEEDGFGGPKTWHGPRGRI